jgi:uncharacterized membrane protein YcfT
MSENLVSLVLVIAYAPLLLMGLLWIMALWLRLAGRPAFSKWLVARTSVPEPEQNPTAASGDKEHR